MPPTTFERVVPRRTRARPGLVRVRCRRAWCFLCVDCAPRRTSARQTPAGQTHLTRRLRVLGLFLTLTVHQLDRVCLRRKSSPANRPPSPAPLPFFFPESAVSFLLTQRAQPKRELQSRPKVPIFFQSFELSGGNVPIFEPLGGSVPIFEPWGGVLSFGKEPAPARVATAVASALCRPMLSDSPGKKNTLAMYAMKTNRRPGAPLT